MTHVIAGLHKAVCWVDGVIQEGVVEATNIDGWIIRLATPEEIEWLVKRPGLVWPVGKDVLIQVFGDARIEMEEG